MSARTRSSAAARAASSLRPETRAASGNGVSSPSTATDVAISLVDGPSVASRCSTNRLTAAGPTACTSFAASAVGAIAAASRARSSSRRNSGLPPVAAWHARQKSSSAPSPRRSRVNAAAASSLSGRGYSATADGREIT